MNRRTKIIIGLLIALAIPLTYLAWAVVTIFSANSAPITVTYSFNVSADKTSPSYGDVVKLTINKSSLPTGYNTISYYYTMSSTPPTSMPGDKVLIGTSTNGANSFEYGWTINVSGTVYVFATAT
jgi:hypothetical protein